MTHVNEVPVLSALDIYKVLEKSGALKLIVIRNGEVFKVNVDPEEA